jgi:hypothetical protein
MDLLVVEGESVVGGQELVAAAQEKGVVCETCGSGFAKQSNLKRHVETKHTDQTTPEAVAKRLSLKEYQKTTRSKRRATDPVYREKQQKINQTYKMRAKARIACAVDGADAAASSATEAEKNAEAEKKAEAEKETGPCEVTRGGVWIPTDVVPTLQPPPTAPKIVEVLDEDGAGVGGAGKPVKKTRKKDNPKGALFHVKTTALTTANVTSFFTPKYDAPRSKEQRAANPRPSEI